MPSSVPSSHESFAAAAAQRLARSGVLADATYTFTYDPGYQEARKLSVRPAGDAFRFYVQGDESTFWVFTADDLWPMGAARAPRTFSVRLVEGKTYRFFEIDGDVIRSDNYTPIPHGHVTAYEADLWLAEHTAEVSA
jgi:hypothetical protein